MGYFSNFNLDSAGDHRDEAALDRRDGFATYACPDSETTRRAGVVSFDRGWNGYGWHCPDCGVTTSAGDAYESVESAAGGLRYHRRQAHGGTR